MTNFTGMNAEPVYAATASATEQPQATVPTTEDAQQPQKRPRKPVEAYSPERAAEMAAQGKTQGRKGCKAHRINMAFDPEIYDYIRTMARVRGESITVFSNRVFEQSMQENAQLYAAARAFKASL